MMDGLHHGAAVTNHTASFTMKNSIQVNSTMHRWSELFIPTLREAPADAEVAATRAQHRDPMSHSRLTAKTRQSTAFPEREVA